MQHKIPEGLISLEYTHVVLVVKSLPTNAGDIGDTGLIPGWGKSPGGVHGNPLEYSCMENLHGQRRLVGYSAQGWKESDTTEATEHAHMHKAARTAAAKLRQSCPTLCDPIDGSPPGSPAPGILQARTLEWVAISFSNAWKGKVKVKSLSRVRLLETPWTAAYQSPLSMGFSRQEYWSGVPLPSPTRTSRLYLNMY